MFPQKVGEQEIGLNISFLQFVIVPVFVGRSLVSLGILQEVWALIGMQASELWTGSRVVLLSGNTCLRRGFRIICEDAGRIPLTVRLRLRSVASNVSARPGAL